MSTLNEKFERIINVKGTMEDMREIRAFGDLLRD
jgi:hypothetical protein